MLLKQFITFILLFLASSAFAIDTVGVKQRIDSLLIKSKVDSIFIYERIKHAENALELSKQINCEECLLRCNTNLGIKNLHLNRYNLAHKYLTTSLTLTQKLGNRAEEARMYYLLGNVFRYLKNYDGALAYYTEFLEIKKEVNDSIDFGSTLNSIGIVYYQLEDLDSSKYYFEKSLEIFEAIEYEYGIPYPLANLGNYYLKIKKYDHSLAYFEKALTIDSLTNNAYGEAVTSCNIGLVYTAKEDYPTALYYFNKCINISEAYDYRKVMYDCYKDISDMYKEDGQMDSALVYYGKYADLKDQVLNSEITDQISNYQTLYEVEKKENDLRESQAQVDLLNERQRSSQYKLWLSLIAISFIISLAILVFFRLRNELKTKQKILEKNKEVQKIKERLSLEQIEKKKKEKEIVEMQLSLKKKDLVNFGLDITRKNEFNEELKKKVLAILRKKSGDLTNELKELLFFVKSNDRINSDLSLFQENVEQTNEEFFERLSTRHPNLSENEKKLCAMIRLGLTIKDIASVKNVSPSSIEMARYRLRKKLGLNKDESLFTFINNI